MGNLEGREWEDLGRCLLVVERTIGAMGDLEGLEPQVGVGGVSRRWGAARRWYGRQAKALEAIRTERMDIDHGRCRRAYDGKHRSKAVGKTEEFDVSVDRESCKLALVATNLWTRNELLGLDWFK